MKRRLNRSERYKVYKELVTGKNVGNRDIVIKAAEEARDAVIAACPWFHQTGTQKHTVKMLMGHMLFHGDLFLTGPKLLWRKTPQTYRIETVNGRLLEFQHGPDGVDYKSLLRPLSEGTDIDKIQRFAPEDVLHVKCAETVEPGFYPYGLPMMEKFIRPEIDINFAAEAARNMINALTAWREKQLWRD